MSLSNRPALFVSMVASLTLASCSLTRPAQTASISTTTSTTSTTVPMEPGWTTVATGAHGVMVDQKDVTVPDGRSITVIRFRAGQVRFGLHIGTQEPPVGKAVLGPDSLSYVGPTESPYLLAAFNGGFKVKDAVGGVEVGGQTLVPLVTGLGSFVIDTNGYGRIGIWGKTVPSPGEQVYSVRQNLPPLIEGGQLSPQIDNLKQWGDTLHGVAAPARSALGEDAAGDILYAAAMSALPIDLATALGVDGATVAMQLDINPMWIQCDVSSTPGGPLSTTVPGQTRPAGQYLVGWTRDFIAVLAPVGTSNTAVSSP